MWSDATDRERPWSMERKSIASRTLEPLRGRDYQWLFPLKKLSSVSYCNRIATLASHDTPHVRRPHAKAAKTSDQRIDLQSRVGIRVRRLRLVWRSTRAVSLIHWRLGRMGIRSA
jgi:hypothetical protein